MVVLIVGCDGSGKTSAIEELKKIYKNKKVVFIKESHPDSFHERWSRVDLIKNRLAEDVVYVYDRATILDDFIYDPIISGTESIFYEDFNYVKDLIKECLVIQVTASLKELKKRLKVRGDEFIFEYQLEAILNKYEDIFKILRKEPIKIKTDISTPKEVAKTIANLLDSKYDIK